MNNDWVEADPQDFLNKVLDCDLINRKGDVIHLSGEVFTEDTLKKCRKHNIVRNAYVYNSPKREEMSIHPAASGKKFYRMARAEYTMYNYYEGWFNSEEEAIEGFDYGDYMVDGEADDHTNIPDKLSEHTKERLEEIKMEDAAAIARELRELEKLKSKYRRHDKR